MGDIATIPQFLVAKVSGAHLKAHPNMLKMLVIRQNPFNPQLLHCGHRSQVCKGDSQFVLQPFGSVMGDVACFTSLLL